jgi:DNA-binding beta-propeller fold protein YncE
MTAAPPGWLAEPGTEPEALIIEARRRQRRRWLAVGVAIAVAAGGAAAVIAGSGAGSRPRPPAAHGQLGHRGVTGAGHTSALVVVGQTSLPKGDSLSLAVGYGAVWVTGVGVTYQVNEVTGRIIRTIPTPGTFPDGCGSGIAAGAGAVWVTHSCTGIYRIDPRSGRVIASLRVAVGGSIAVADGLVWVEGNGGLVRIQPRTGKVTGKPVPVGSGGYVLTPGAGALWVTSYGTGDVYRVDEKTGAVRRLADATVTDIEAVGAGSLWSSQVQRVDPATGKVIASVWVPGASQVAFWKGSAWALTLQRALEFLRIDPATNKVTGKPVPLGTPQDAKWNTEPTAIATGPTGIWVLDFYRNLLYHLAMKPARP